MTETIILRYSEAELHPTGVDGDVAVTSWKDECFLGRKKYLFLCRAKPESQRDIDNGLDIQLDLQGYYFVAL